MANAKQTRGIYLVDEFRFTGLYLKHFLLDRSLSDHPEDRDRFLLSNTVRAIDRLILDGFLMIVINASI